MTYAPLENPLSRLNDQEAYQDVLRDIQHYSKLYREAKSLSATDRSYSDEARSLYLKLSNLRARRKELEVSQIPLLVSISTSRSNLGKKTKLGYYIPEIDAVVYDIFYGKGVIAYRKRCIDLTKSPRCAGKSVTDIIADAKQFINRRFGYRNFKGWTDLRASISRHYRRS